ncbi:MAG: UDP-N-acetylmuramate--L-alanine ligase [Anaerolineales bacterium]|nr:UDP-N-acetylmuramate--L-alanine ligase [Anaerolineales bacterium]
MTHVHFVGIGGSGLSAIARLLLESGYTVTGSDHELSPFAVDLQKSGATVHIGHAAEHISGADWVVRSSAIPEDNLEVQAALAAGIPVYKRADFLGRLMADKTGIAIAGTHGKTSTTAMLAWTLSELDQDPSFICGSTLNNLGVNAHAGKGDTFVIEADEYDRMFLGLQPTIAIITNVEHDHPDCYPTFGNLIEAFESFVELLPNNGTLIACAEDTVSFGLINHARRHGRRTIAYTIQNEITLTSPLWVMARNVKRNQKGGFTFEAISNAPGGNFHSIKVELQVPGKYNVTNSLAVLAVIALLQLPLDKAADALARFNGTKRRFELHGDANGVSIYDDYAHHPTEILATLAAARSRFPDRRIWAVWQPHTYSRTQMLQKEFSQAFGKADHVIVSEIYAAREAKQGYSARQVVQAMQHASVKFIETLPEISNYLLDHLKSGDVVLVLSAGDAIQISAEVLERLEKKEKQYG